MFLPSFKKSICYEWELHVKWKVIESATFLLCDTDEHPSKAFLLILCDPGRRYKCMSYVCPEICVGYDEYWIWIGGELLRTFFHRSGWVAWWLSRPLVNIIGGERPNVILSAPPTLLVGSSNQSRFNTNTKDVTLRSAGWDLCKNKYKYKYQKRDGVLLEQNHMRFTAMENTNTNTKADTKREIACSWNRMRLRTAKKGHNGGIFPQTAPPWPVHTCVTIILTKSHNNLNAQLDHSITLIGQFVILAVYVATLIVTRLVVQMRALSEERKNT